MKTQSEKLNAAFEYEAQYMGEDRAIDKKMAYPHDLWNLKINGIAVEYKTGLGLREKSQFARDSWRYHEPKPKAPSIDDVIYCLLSDFSVSQDSFEDFCLNMGYNTDSRSALETYLACQENGKKLHKIGINISQAQTAFENY